MVASTTKKATVAKTTAKPKAPPKPKFGELGYTFNIQAKIVDVNDNNDEYPFVIQIDLGDFEEYDGQHDGKVNFMYSEKKDLLNIVSKNVPALAKSLKQDELNKAKAEVARLTKELAAIK